MWWQLLFPGAHTALDAVEDSVMTVGVAAAVAPADAIASSVGHVHVRSAAKRGTDTTQKWKRMRKSRLTLTPSHAGLHMEPTAEILGQHVHTCEGTDVREDRYTGRRYARKYTGKTRIYWERRSVAGPHTAAADSRDAFRQSRRPHDARGRRREK